MFVQLQKAFLGKQPGERIDVDQEHAEKLIDLGVAAAVTDDLITPAVSKALEGAFKKFSAGLDSMIDQSLKQFANAQGQARKHAVPAIFGPDDVGNGDPHHSFGDWLLAVRRGDSKYLVEKYDSYQVEGGDGRSRLSDQKSAMVSTSGTSGGYTVP